MTGWGPSWLISSSQFEKDCAALVLSQHACDSMEGLVCSFTPLLHTRASAVPKHAGSARMAVPMLTTLTMASHSSIAIALPLVARLLIMATCPPSKKTKTDRVVLKRFAERPKAHEDTTASGRFHLWLLLRAVLLIERRGSFQRRRRAFS